MLIESIFSFIRPVQVTVRARARGIVRDRGIIERSIEDVEERAEL